MDRIVTSLTTFLDKRFELNVATSAIFAVCFGHVEDAFVSIHITGLGGNAVRIRFFSAVMGTPDYEEKTFTGRKALADAKQWLEDSLSAEE